MRARLHSNKAPFAPGDAPARITWRGRVLKGPAGRRMLAAGVPRALCRLAARRCPAGFPPSRTVWRGGARGEEGGGGGRTGFARRRWARPVGGALGLLGAFSLFPRDAEEEGEDAIILLLKRAKLSVMKGELGEAERVLHQALRLSHQSDNRKAIVYTYSMMANVAFMQGQLDNTVILINDLATVLDAQGHYDEAYSYVKRAAELAKETQHPEEHMVLNNLAAILMHKEDFLQAKQVYKEALKQAQQKGDVASVQHIQEELAELAKRRKGSK
uniref:Tetratricopeptide repeat domain 19 n=1 Tax=Aquila chrysaetos chrysaetos TaxID=223781 RepID=A0A663FDV9_AQUCH